MLGDGCLFEMRREADIPVYIPLYRKIVFRELFDYATRRPMT